MARRQTVTPSASQPDRLDLGPRRHRHLRGWGAQLLRRAAGAHRGDRWRSRASKPSGIEHRAVRPRTIVWRQNLGLSGSEAFARNLLEETSEWDPIRERAAATAERRPRSGERGAVTALGGIPAVPIARRRRRSFDPATESGCTRSSRRRPLYQRSRHESYRGALEPAATDAALSVSDRAFTRRGAGSPRSRTGVPAGVLDVERGGRAVQQTLPLVPGRRARARERCASCATRTRGAFDVRRGPWCARAGAHGDDDLAALPGAAQRDIRRLRALTRSSCPKTGSALRGPRGGSAPASELPIPSVEWARGKRAEVERGGLRAPARALDQVVLCHLRV